jgi:hypothetical protein
VDPGQPAARLDEAGREPLEQRGQETANDQRRQQPTEPLGVEVPCRLRGLGAERDAIAADDEEEEHAERAAVEDRQRNKVKRQDPDDGDCAQAVDRG